jgi:uncharacterized Zn finger protein (UPF0148 family)
MKCPACGALFFADPGHTCPMCEIALEPVTRRRRTAPVTTPITPEEIREEVSARIEANRTPAPERVVYRWPDEPVDDEEITKV